MNAPENQPQSIAESDIHIDDNWLSVDGQYLRTKVLRHSYEKRSVTPKQLGHILDIGRFVILDSILAFDWPGADTTPSIYTLHLANQQQTQAIDGKLFTAKGHRNGGINEARDEITEPFRPYWDAIKNAGFRPEIRRTFKTSVGAWMLLRQPTIMQVSTDWLDFHEVPASRHLRADIKDGDVAVGARLERSTLTRLGAAKKQQDEYIDAVDDSLKDLLTSDERRAERSRQQVGTLLAQLAIKERLFQSPQEESIEEILDYAHYDENIDDGTVRAIENAVY